MKFHFNNFVNKNIRCWQDKRHTHTLTLYTVMIGFFDMSKNTVAIFKRYHWFQLTTEKILDNFIWDFSKKKTIISAKNIFWKVISNWEQRHNRIRKENDSILSI